MKTFTLNREFLVRHLGVTLLMAGLGCWFVFDGAVTYPKMDAVAFCEKHHKSLENPEREKANAIERQYQFASLAFIAALAIGCHLLKVRGESLAWDDEKMIGSLTYGKEVRFSDVKEVDRRLWDRKGILRVTMNDGRKITLDAWHHPEAKELEPKFGDAGDRIFGTL